LRVTGQGHADVIDAKVVTARDLAGPFDLVLLSVKATGLAEALDDLAPAVGPDTAVVPFLNGLDHMRVLNERFGPQRVLGGVVVVATIGALTCLFRGTIGEVAAAPGGSEVGPAILGEAASVAAAAGHPLPPPDRDALIRLLTDPGSPMTSSLYRDLQAGRGTEVEQILGDLISRAHALGIATPVLDLATLALRVHQRRIHNSPPPQGPAG